MQTANFARQQAIQNVILSTNRGVPRGFRANFRHTTYGLARFGLISETGDWAMKGLSRLNQRAGRKIGEVSDNLVDYASNHTNPEGIAARAAYGAGDTIGKAGQWVGNNADRIRNVGLAGAAAGGVAGGTYLGTRQRKPQMGY